MPIASRVTEGQRKQMIAEAAYFRAASRGFAAGDPVADWIEAEIEVDTRLREIESSYVLERLEEGVAVATKQLNALKNKASRIAAEARAGWQRDVDRLGVLRDTLRGKLEQLRERGQQAEHKGRQQAEKVWDEIAEILQRLSVKKASATRRSRGGRPPAAESKTELHDR